MGRWEDVLTVVGKGKLFVVGIQLVIATAGGVAWENIHVKTMESKFHAGLFFAGELVDMDGITGGFNFQAAWTTGFVAGNNAGITK